MSRAQHWHFNTSAARSFQGPFCKALRGLFRHFRMSSSELGTEKVLAIPRFLYDLHSGPRYRDKILELATADIQLLILHCNKLNRQVYYVTSWSVRCEDELTCHSDFWDFCHREIDIGLLGNIGRGYGPMILRYVFTSTTSTES